MTKSLELTIPETNSTLSIPDMYAQVSALPTERLRDELARGLAMTATNLVRLAVIVRALEERGEDLSELHGLGMVAYLRQIAHGQVLPEAVVRFSGYPMLLERVRGLPLPDQKRLTDGETVKLVILTDGRSDHRLADPLKLTRDQVSQVFARDHIRDEQEQRAMLEDRQARPKPSKPVFHGRIRADRERDGIVIGKTFVPAGDVLGAMADLRGGESVEEFATGDEAMVTAVVKLTVAERERLKRAALNARSSMQELIYRALQSAGVI